MKLFAAIVLSVFAVGAIASDPPDNRPPDNRPPDRPEKPPNETQIEQIVTVSDDSVHENVQTVHTGNQNVALEIAPGAVEVSVVVPESPWKSSGFGASRVELKKTRAPS